MANRGAWAIATMFGVGLVLAGGSVIYHYQKGRRALDFWGPADAELIRHAPRVELWQLAGIGDDGVPHAESAAQADSVPDSAPDSASLDDVTLDDVTIDGTRRRIQRRLAIDQVRGLVHARHALIVDANYDWARMQATAGADIPPDAWTHALSFEREGRSVVLLFDFKEARVRRLDPPATACLQSTIAAAEQALVDRELNAAR